MFRHGVRSWVKNFPNEPINKSVWDKYGGMGQLTSVGVKQMTEFGGYFRNYYEKLMKIPFDHSKVKATSTDFNRTIASCKYFLRGIFKNNTIRINSDKKLNENVISIFLTEYC